VTVRAIITLIGAILVCAAIVLFGPDLAQAARAMLPEAQQADMPLVETLFTAIIFMPLLLIALFAARLSGGNALALGRKPLATIGSGLLIGIAGVVGAIGYAWLAGTLDRAPQQATAIDTILWGSGVVLFAAAVEEIYFRGWLQPVLARSFGVPVAILLSALAFAALHVMGGARSPTTLVNLFLGGLLFGLLAARGGGIAGAVAAHFAWNWSESIALGLDPNPGVGSFGALIDLELGGAALWGGSEEGLNASLAMSLTLFALLVPFLILLRGHPLRRAPAPPVTAE
jgi:membrane protease YdiL (CAAX protease family)